MWYTLLGNFKAKFSADNYITSCLQGDLTELPASNLTVAEGYAKMEVGYL